MTRNKKAGSLQKVSSADIFDAAMSSDGGRLDLERAPDFWQYFKAVADEMIPTKDHFPRMPSVHFDFVSNSSLQAVAFLNRGQYFIGVYVGTLWLLNTIFSTILSDRRVFTEIGNARCDAAAHSAVEAVEWIVPQFIGMKASVEGLNEAFEKTGKDYAKKLFDHSDYVLAPQLHHLRYHDYWKTHDITGDELDNTNLKE